MTKEELKKILDEHKKWLDGTGGKRANLQDADLRYADLRYADLRDADLRYANLQGADLRDADLRDADLNFSCWPLWCGTKQVKLCKKLQAQLLAHALQVAVDVEVTEEQRQFIKQNFHRKAFFTR